MSAIPEMMQLCLIMFDLLGKYNQMPADVRTAGIRLRLKHGLVMTVVYRAV